MRFSDLELRKILIQVVSSEIYCLFIIFVDGYRMQVCSLPNLLADMVVPLGNPRTAVLAQEEACAPGHQASQHPRRLLRT